MVNLQTISYFIFGLQCFIGAVNRKAGVGLFLFFIIITPSQMPLFDFFELNLHRSLIFVALILYLSKWKFKTDRRTLKAIFLFSILMIPSFTIANYSEGFPKGLYIFIFYFLLNNLLPGLLIFNFIRATKDYKTILNWYLAALFVMCAYGIFEFFSDKNIFIDLLKAYSAKNENTIFDYFNDDRLGFSRRIQSTSWHPIAYGGFLAFSLGLILFTFLEKVYSRDLIFKRVSILILLLLALINIFLSLSRTAWFSAALCIIYILFKKNNNLLKGKSTIKLLGIMYVLPLIIFCSFRGLQALSEIDFGGSSLEMRYKQWDYIYSMFLNSWFTGFGNNAIASFLKLDTHGEGLGFESAMFSYPINFGILGLGAFFLLYRHCYSAMNKFRETQFSVYFNGVFFSFISFIVLTGEMETLSSLWILFCLFYALMLSRIETQSMSRGQSDK